MPPPHQRWCSVTRQKHAPVPWVIFFFPATALHFVYRDGRFLATETTQSCTDDSSYECNIDALQHSCNKADDDEEFLVTLVDSGEEL